MGLFSDFAQKGSSFQPGGSGSVTSSLVSNTNNLKKSFNDLAKTGNDIVSDREKAATDDMLAQINSIKDPETLAAANAQIASGAFDNNVDRAQLLNATKSREAGIRQDIIAEDTYNLKVQEMGDREGLERFQSMIANPNNDDGSQTETILAAIAEDTNLSDGAKESLYKTVKTEIEADETFAFDMKKREFEELTLADNKDRFADKALSERFLIQQSESNRANKQGYFERANAFINNGNNFLSVDGSGTISAKEGATPDQIRAGVELQKQLRAEFPFLDGKQRQAQYQAFLSDPANDINLSVGEAGFATIEAQENRRNVLSQEAQISLASQSITNQRSYDSSLKDIVAKKEAGYKRAPVDEYITIQQEGDNVSTTQVIEDMEADARAAREDNKTSTNQLGDNQDDDLIEITNIAKMLNDYNAKTFMLPDPDNKGSQKEQRIPGWISRDAYKKVTFGGVFIPGSFATFWDDKETIDTYKTEVQRLLKLHVKNMVNIKTREELDAKFNAESLQMESALQGQNTEAQREADAISNIFRNLK